MVLYVEPDRAGALWGLRQCWAGQAHVSITLEQRDYHRALRSVAIRPYGISFDFIRAADFAN